jgi:hypothetical protein
VNVFVGVYVGRGWRSLERTGKRLYNKEVQPNNEAELRAPVAKLKAHGPLLSAFDQSHLLHACFIDVADKALAPPAHLAAYAIVAPIT